jgi:protein-disulfide isomerase
MTRCLPSFALALAALACARPPAAPAAPAAAAQEAKAPAGPDISLDPSLTVAVIDGVPITAAELDGKIADEVASATDEYLNKVHELRRETLEEMVAGKLVEMEAKARGVDPRELMKAEVEDKSPAPSDDEVRAAYERVVKPSNPGVSFEMARPHLARQLGEQVRQRRAIAFFDDLKAKYKAKVTLPGPRIARADVPAVGPSRGPVDAKVTIVEFSDFECPFCSRATDSVKQVEKAYEGKVRVVFRHYPLPFHKQAQKAAEAAACADEQGKFWEMHDRLFAQQDKLSVSDLKDHARLAGLDAAKFDACLDSGRAAAIVEKDMAAGKKARVNGTPAFFVNGRSLSGAQPFEAFKTVIDEELAAK